MASTQTRPLGESLKGYGRGVVGGLLFALAPLYTSEVWWQGFIAQPSILLLSVVATLLVLVAYAHYAGIHNTDRLINEVFEAFEILAIGFVTGFIVLKLLGQLPSGLSLEVTINRLVLEGLVSSIGVAVGSAQLGQNPDDGGSKASQEQRGLIHEVAYSVLGALLVVAGFAPTMEIVVIALEAPPWAVFLTAILSYLIALGVMGYFDFRGSKRVSEQGSIYAGGPVGDAAVTYSIAIVLSAILLWTIGRFDGAGLAPSVFMVVYLAFPATVGAAVGRLIL